MSRFCARRLRPNDLSSEFFAAISALLGFLFAFNAMLLTAPERRRVIADLRLAGTRRTAIVEMVLFQALCLGLLASVVGLFVGYGLSVGFFHESPGYLAQAFTLGGSTVIGVLPLVLSLVIGVLASCVASAVPCLTCAADGRLTPCISRTAYPGTCSIAERRARSLSSLPACSCWRAAMFVLLPALALATCVVLALATVLAIPLISTGVLRAAGALASA